MKLNELLLAIKMKGEEKLFIDWLFDYESIANTEEVINKEIISEFKNLKSYALLKRKDIKYGNIKYSGNSYDHIKPYQYQIENCKPTDYDVEDLKNKLMELEHFDVIRFATFLDENEYKAKILSYNNLSFGNKLNYVKDDGTEYFKERNLNNVNYDNIEPIIDFSGLFV